MLLRQALEWEKRLPGAKLVAIMERDYIHGNIDNSVKRKRVIQGYMAFLHQMVGYMAFPHQMVGYMAFPYQNGKVHGISAPNGRVYGISTPNGRVHGISIPNGKVHGISAPNSRVYGISTPNGRVYGISAPNGRVYGISAPNGRVYGILVQNVYDRYMLRRVKDWVHVKTAKMMQDFNCFCNLDVNHKLLLMFIIKVVYLCTLHNKISSPTHFVVYMLWQPMPTWFSNKNA